MLNEVYKELTKLVAFYANNARDSDNVNVILLNLKLAQQDINLLIKELEVDENKNER